MPNKKEFIKQTDVELAVSSVNITKNSKGVNVAVKVYDLDPFVAAEKAERIFNDLNKKYTEINNDN